MLRHFLRVSNLSVNLAASALFAMLGADAFPAPTTIISNGSPANRVDILYVGDGYTQADLDAGLYDQHIQVFLNHMFTTGGVLADPLPRYRNFFNVHKITVVSNESGADIPSQSIFRDTALDATYETEGIERFLSIDGEKADMLRDAELAGTGIVADVRLAAVNHSKYGGAVWDGWAVYAGANPNAPEYQLHEFGHAFANLFDEYGGDPSTYTGPEPTFAPNVTKDATGQKWSHWSGFVDPRDESLTIGAHEGAAGYDHGLYRPSLNSKMRNLYRPFDAVSREWIIQTIYEHVDPLDNWLDNSGEVVDAELWAEVVDSDVIQLQWFVDGVLIEGASGPQFRAREFGYGAGTYEVRVRAYDEVLNHSFSGDMLDLVRSNLDDLEQSVTWSLTITQGNLGDYDGNGAVEIDDYELWRKTMGSTELLAADGNDDGFVDASDYVLWQKIFESSGVVVNAVPEPGWATLEAALIVLSTAIQRAVRRSSHANKFASISPASMPQL
jgi:hypothetical protein